MPSDIKGHNTALPWYTAEDYVRVLELLPPSEEYPAITYDEWLERLERCEKAVLNNGAIPVRIPVDPVAFKSWCDGQKKPLSRDMLNAFIMVKLGNKLMAKDRN